MVKPLCPRNKKVPTATLQRSGFASPIIDSGLSITGTAKEKGTATAPADIVPPLFWPRFLTEKGRSKGMGAILPFFRLPCFRTVGPASGFDKSPPVQISSSDFFSSVLPHFCFLLSRHTTAERGRKRIQSHPRRRRTKIGLDSSSFPASLDFFSLQKIGGF